jgi:DNA uptake protein ComE-like DNA-binding protein
MRSARFAALAVAWMAERLAYRRQELAVAGLLAASVLGGFAIDGWHRRAPALLDRLEAEPPRLAAVARAPGHASRPRAESAPAREPRARRERPHTLQAVASLKPRRPAPAPDPPPSATRPVDLNRAAADELARLPEIGPRLAARIQARREELGGRFHSFEEFATTPGLGARRAGRLRPLVRVPEEPRAPEPADPLAGTPP